MEEHVENVKIFLSCVAVATLLIIGLGMILPFRTMKKAYFAFWKKQLQKNHKSIVTFAAGFITCLMLVLQHTPP